MPGEETVEISAKLKLDTSEAESKLKGVSDKVSKGGAIKLGMPKDSKITLPKEITKDVSSALSGPKGLGAIGKVLRGATNGVGGALSSLTQVFNSLSSPKVAGVFTLILAVVSVLIKLMSGTDTWKAMQDALTQLKDLFTSSLEGTIASIGEIIIEVVDILMEVLPPILQVVTKIIEIALRPILLVVRMLQPVAALIGGILDVVAELLDGPLSILQGILLVICDVLELAMRLLEPFAGIFHVLAAGIKVVFGYVKDFIKFISFGLIDFSDDSLSSTGKQNNASAKSSLDTWETTTGDKVADAADSLKESATTFEDVGKSFGEVWNKSVDSIRDQLSKTFGEFAKNWNAFWDNFGKGWNNFWSGVGDWFKGVWGGIVNWWQDVWSSVTTFFVDTIPNWFAGVWDAVVNFFSKQIPEFFQQVWDWIVNIFSGIGDFFGDVGNNIADGWNNFWGGVSDTAQNTGNAVGNWFSDVGDAIGGWFESWWPFANGGTLQTGTQMWGMNEQGNPEFLFNAGGHDTVINKEILSDALYAALKRAEGGKSQRIEVSLKDGTPAGPRELAQWLLPSLKFVLK